MSDAHRIVVAGHQPNFLPWFGFFEKMLKCDVFVYSDDVQYPKQCYTNRVQMLVGGAPVYLTLAVTKGNDMRIADKLFLRDEVACKKLIKTLRLNLGGLPHFGDVVPIIDEIEKAFWLSPHIAAFNVHMNQFIARAMGIHTEVRLGTELGLEHYHRNERLAERCRLLNSDIYLCGQGADSYQDEKFLNAAGVELRRIDYVLGRTVFGEDLPFTVLQGIARQGLFKIRAAVDAYRAETATA